MSSKRPRMLARELIATSIEYLDYLERHLNNIERAWNLVQDRCGDMTIISDPYYRQGIEVSIRQHDRSKLGKHEFTQYRDAFYPVSQVSRIGSSIEDAIEHHYAANEHHWQHWTKKIYSNHNDWKIACTHMVVDWIAMGFAKGQSAYSYYEKNKDEIELPIYAIRLIGRIFDRVYPEESRK